jgi:two-component system, cell cycle response regulator DivK
LAKIFPGFINLILINKKWWRIFKLNLIIRFMIYNWSKHTVLVAEDDSINFKFLSLLLEKRTGIKVVWAKNGLEAYEKIINYSAIDVVLLDYQLPELNGLDVLRQVKRAFPEIPVIMQTANSWGSEEKLCKQAGCDAFFSKPFDIERLFESMDSCIEKYYAYKIERQIS